MQSKGVVVVMAMAEIRGGTQHTSETANSPCKQAGVMEKDDFLATAC